MLAALQTPSAAVILFLAAVLSSGALSWWTVTVTAGLPSVGCERAVWMWMGTVYGTPFANNRL
jgi:hypothetical protein